MESAKVKRIYNFSSGPAVMPLPVLERAREEMLSIGGTGMSVMEMSHRSKFFTDVIESAEHKLRGTAQRAGQLPDTLPSRRCRSPVLDDSHELPPFRTIGRISSSRVHGE
jgi:hypothetical protein